MLGSNDLPVWGIIRIPLAYLRPDKSQNDACMATNKSQATFRLAKPYRKWSDSDRGILTQAILCNDDICYGRSSTAAEPWKGLGTSECIYLFQEWYLFRDCQEEQQWQLKRSTSKRFIDDCCFISSFMMNPGWKYITMHGGFEGFWDPPK